MKDFSSQILLQQQASDPQNSVWVFASAGCGKTKILTDRVLRLLLADVAPGKILCLTFTKVAAAEMQSRINAQLSQWIIDDEDELKAKLQKLTNSQVSEQMLNQARSLLIKTLDSEFGLKIQTIHSFCQSLLSSFPFEAQINASFELLAQVQVKTALKKAQQQVITKVLEPEFGEKRQEILSLKESIEKIAAQISDEGLFSLVAKLLAKKDKLLFLQEKFGSLEQITKQLCLVFNFSPEKILPGNGLEIETEEVEAQIFVEFFQKIEVKKFQQVALQMAAATQKTSQNFAAKLSEFLAQPNPSTLLQLSAALLTSATGNEESQIRKTLLRSCLGSPASTQNFQEELQELASLLLDFEFQISSFRLVTKNADLLRFVFCILDEYQTFKKSNGYLDYGDLISLAMKLLLSKEHRDFVRMKMDGLFDHILVDESQDTNFEQWQIITALAEEFFVGEEPRACLEIPPVEAGNFKTGSKNQQRSIFVVGDEKQSIYGFQGAEIKTAGQALQYLKTSFPLQTSARIREISLNISFRSKEKILQAVDLVFADEARQKAICQIGSYSSHQSYRGSGGYVELWKPIASEVFESEEENLVKEVDDKTRKKDEVLDENSSQDFSWELLGIVGNIADSEALAGKKSDQQILAELIAKKILFWVESKRQINGRKLQFSDVMILLHNKTNGLAQSLFREFAKNSIPTASINKIKSSQSLIIQDFLALARFALLPEDDFNLACLLKSPFFNLSEEELFEFCQQKNHNKTSLIKVLQDCRFAKKLNQIQELAANSSCLEFFYHLLFEPQNRANLVLRMGKQVESLIDSFIFLVVDFCENSKSELQLFLDFVEQTDPELDASFGEENAVRITTIHSAKGLQAPIVIMPDCLHDLNRFLANTETIIWLENLPLWISSDAKENFLVKNLKKKRAEKNFEEYLRLLYVGMTRAEDELYIGGFGNKKSENSWYKILQTSLAGFAVEVDLLAQTKNQDAEIASKSGFANKNLKESKILANDSEFVSKLSGKRSTEFIDEFSSEFNFFGTAETNEKRPKDSQKKRNSDYLPDAAEFGTAIHCGLEFLVSFAAKFKLSNSSKSDVFFVDKSSNFFKNLIKNFSARQNLKEVQKHDLQALLTNFFQSEILTEIFSDALEVKCEAEIAFDDKSGRIDLLVEKGDEIWIIDYKSDEALPDKPYSAYQQQLKNYFELAKKVFPTKKIRVGLLWIRFLKLDWVETV